MGSNRVLQVNSRWQLPLIQRIHITLSECYLVKLFRPNPLVLFWCQSILLLLIKVAHPVLWQMLFGLSGQIICAQDVITVSIKGSLTLYALLIFMEVVPLVVCGGLEFEFLHIQRILFPSPASSALSFRPLGAILDISVDNIAKRKFVLFSISALLKPLSHVGAVV